jgi:hypothetical protein
VTAGGGSVVPVAVLTGSDGVARVTRWTVGTAAGINTVTAAPEGLQAVTFTATGIGPHSLQRVTADSQDAPAGAAVAQPPAIRVLDPLGRNLPGVTVRFAVTGGGGAITPDSTISGSDGVARLIGWVLGAEPGVNTVSASVTGLAPVAFTALGTDTPCPQENLSITFGSTVNATLGVTGCRLTTGEFVDFYTFTIPDTRTLRIRQSSSAFDAYVLLLKEDGTPVAENDDALVTSADAEVLVRLHAGTYLLAATSSDVGESGAYTLRIDEHSFNVTNCKPFFVMRPVTNVSQSLATTDCEDFGFWSDYYWVYLSAGESITITMSSSNLTPHLTLLPPGSADFIEADGRGPGQPKVATLTYTAAASGYHVVGASSFESGQTGPYTLSIQ